MENNTLIDRTLSFIKSKRQNIVNGDINCIPTPFECFSEDFPGIQQGKYYLVSAHQKAGKTQLSSFIFLFTPILYAYNNPDKLKLKIFYYPLEETQEKITLRFMSFLLYTLSNYNIQISTDELSSVREALDSKVIELLESEEYQNILKFFQEVVEFRESSNPTGCYKDLKKYAEANGIIHKKKISYPDKITGEIIEQEVFDYYEPYNPKEYVMIIYDHLSLITQEQGMDLRQSMNKLSEYMVYLRNTFNYIPVVIQQQGQDTQNLEAFKANKIRPSVSGLSDSKYTSRDCNLMLGLINPYAFEIPEYLGYNISMLRNNIRFLEVVLNRDGNSNGVLPLYFNGKCCYFQPLPSPKNETAMKKVYELINNQNKKKPTLLTILRSKRFKKLKKKKYVQNSCAC